MHIRYDFVLVSVHKLLGVSSVHVKCELFWAAVCVCLSRVQVLYSSGTGTRYSGAVALACMDPL